MENLEKREADSLELESKFKGFYQNSTRHSKLILKEEIKSSKKILQNESRNQHPTVLEVAVLMYIKKISTTDSQAVFTHSQISNLYKIEKSSLQRILKRICQKGLAVFEDFSIGVGGFVKYSLTQKAIDVLQKPTSKLRMHLFLKTKKVSV